MKQKPWNKWYLVSGILQLGCCVKLAFEWLRYSDSLNSAPFDLTVWLHVVAFGVPAALCFLIGFYLEKGKDDPHENSH